MIYHSSIEVLLARQVPRYSQLKKWQKQELLDICDLLKSSGMYSSDENIVDSLCVIGTVMNDIRKREKVIAKGVRV